MLTRFCLTASVGLGLALPALAKPVTVNVAPSMFCADATVLAMFSDSSTAAFTACVGPISGNLVSNQANIDGILDNISSSFGLDLDVLGKSDGIGFGPFTGNPGTNSGALTFDQALYGPFVLGLKAGNEYSLYEFDFDADNLGVVSVQFNTLGAAVNGNGIGQALSHAALFGGEGTFIPPPSFPPTLDPLNGVPEPGSLALLMAGTAALGWARRRRT